jgi:hypothetical protein
VALFDRGFPDQCAGTDPDYPIEPVTDDIYAEHGWTAEVPGVAAHPQEIHRVFHCSRKGLIQNSGKGHFLSVGVMPIDTRS